MRMILFTPVPSGTRGWSEVAGRLGEWPHYKTWFLREGEAAAVVRHERPHAACAHA
jgi:hypothetical protein